MQPSAVRKVIPIAPGAAAETEGVVAAWMRRYDCHAALVRPDHYVFGVARTPTDLGNLIDQWRSALGLSVRETRTHAHQPAKEAT